jgi:hypothetical protein
MIMRIKILMSAALFVSTFSSFAETCPTPDQINAAMKTTTQQGLRIFISIGENQIGTMFLSINSGTFMDNFRGVSVWKSARIAAGMVICTYNDNGSVDGTTTATTASSGWEPKELGLPLINNWISSSFGTTCNASIEKCQFKLKGTSNL